MANITAKDVAALRAKTGIGMMECKKALVEADGDIEAHACHSTYVYFPHSLHPTLRLRSASQRHTTLVDGAYGQLGRI